MHQLLKILAFVVPLHLVFGKLYLTFDCYFYWIEKAAVIYLVLGVTSWKLGNLLYDRLYNNQRRFRGQGKAVFVTGCDSGFGLQLAKRLPTLGFHVFAGVLDEQSPGAKELKLLPQVTILRMNVTNSEEVDQAVRAIEASRKPLWAVVNNAGIAVSVPWDWGADVDEFRKVLEVNTLGAIRVAKRTIHLLRATSSRGSGNARLVNIASAAGRLIAPQMAHYSLSKMATRAFSDSVRREEAPLAEDVVAVVTIEPAFYRTPIVNEEALRRSTEAIRGRTPPEIAAHYECEKNREEFARVRQGAMDFMELLMHEEVGEVVQAMVDAVTLLEPKPIIRCTGLVSYVLVWLGAHFPEVMVDFVMLAMLQVRIWWSMLVERFSSCVGK